MGVGAGGGALGALYSQPRLRGPFREEGAQVGVQSVSGMCLIPHPS